MPDADKLADISFAEVMEELQLFLEELLQGFNTLQQAIFALIMKFLADFPAEIAKFLDLDVLIAGFNDKVWCEV